MNGGIIGKREVSRLGILSSQARSIISKVGYKRHVLDLSQNTAAQVDCGSYNPFSGAFTINMWAYLLDFSKTNNTPLTKRSSDWVASSMVFNLNVNNNTAYLTTTWPGGQCRTNSYSAHCCAKAWVNLSWIRASGGSPTFRINASDGIPIYSGSSVTLGTGTGATLGLGGIGAGTDAFNGYLANVSIWDTELSQAQIREVMHSRLRGDEANLKCYWPLDGDANDKCGNANGTLSNGARFISVLDFPVAA